MNNIQFITQAYAQTPWRRQLQLIGLFLLILIMGALIAGVYLNVTARAATIGRSIQQMHYTGELLDRDIEELRTRLAILTSNTQMRTRAEEMGFGSVDPGNVIYLIVPGYTRPDVVVLADPPDSYVPSANTIPDDFTQSLFDWLRERIFDPASLLMEAKP